MLFIHFFFEDKGGSAVTGSEAFPMDPPSSATEAPFTDSMHIYCLEIDFGNRLYAFLDSLLRYFVILSNHSVGKSIHTRNCRAGIKY